MSREQASKRMKIKEKMANLRDEKRELFEAKRVVAMVTTHEDPRMSSKGFKSWPQLTEGIARLQERMDTVLGRANLQSPLKQKDLRKDFEREATDDESDQMSVGS